MDLRVSAGPFHEGSPIGIRSCASAWRCASYYLNDCRNPDKHPLLQGIHLFGILRGTGVVWGCGCIRIDPTLSYHNEKSASPFTDSTPFITDNKTPHLAAYHVDSADKQAAPQNSRRPLHRYSRIHSHSDAMPQRHPKPSTLTHHPYTYSPP